MQEYIKFWGKACEVEGSAEIDWHPLPYHSLDVAATVEAYLISNPSVLRHLASLFNIPTTQTLSLASFMAACHDVGKFGMGFQSKVPQLLAQLFPAAVAIAEKGPHSQAGLPSLLEFLHGAWFPSFDVELVELLLEPLANATCGHHGKPEQQHLRPLAGPSGIAARLYLADVSKMFGLEKGLPAPGPGEDIQGFVHLEDSAQRLRDASWLLAGVITLCDWVGSSRYLFQYVSAGPTLTEYWPLTQKKAKIAIEACGLSEKRASITCGFDWLFGHGRANAEAGYLAKSPTPLQLYAEQVMLPTVPCPSLFVLEDETGAGKTEAALTLASRLVSGGFARGVLFTLPTQTTANAVFERVGPVVHRFFDHLAAPSVSLAHGNAKLALARLREAQAANGTITSDLASWAQERSKTALLADFGVGTVDQVAMAGLPVKHVVLRQLGLAKKVLIVDEAHACEPYLLDILKNGLTLHARMGGSAIILSATLSRAAKTGLLEAFAQGLRAPAPAALTGTAYPLATAYWPGYLDERPIAGRKTPRTLAFAPVHESDVPALVKTWVSAGSCICLMKNTVATAQAAYSFYKALYPGKVTLVHARFVLAHRGTNDEALLKDFGKNSTSASRAGRIVIATQVAEQSLDVDFDEMVTDLAPIDSLLQRDGRHRRHVRDSQGNPASTEGRGPSPLHVVAPAVGDNPSFISELPVGTAYVYPMPGVLFRTAEIVCNWTSISIPADVRKAVENAYDATAAVPAFLSDLDDDAFGKILAQKQHARVSMLVLDEGYSAKAGIELIERSVTRLGEPSVQVVVCDEKGKPLFSGTSGDIGLSVLSIRASLLGLPVSTTDGKIWLNMALDGAFNLTAAIVDARQRRGIATYSREAGFTLKFGK